MYRLILPVLALLVACSAADSVAVTEAPTSTRPPIVRPEPTVPIEVAVPVVPPVLIAVVPPVAAVEAHHAVYKLARGESLDSFAKYSGVPVEVIAKASGLRLDDVHAVGTQVRVPVDADGEKALTERRDVARAARVDRWFASRGGEVGTIAHTVRTGDTAWQLTRDSGVPLWVLEAYNPGVNLDRLKPGQELAMPLVGTAVAAAIVEPVAPVEADAGAAVAEAAPTEISASE